MKGYVSEIDSFNLCQQNYDSAEDRSFDLCYKTEEQTELEKETAYQEKILIKDAQEQGDEGTMAFLDYCQFTQTEGISDELLECLSTVIAAAASGENNHDPLTRFVSAALSWKAEQLATEVLR